MRENHHPLGSCVFLNEKCKEKSQFSSKKKKMGAESINWT